MHIATDTFGKELAIRHRFPTGNQDIVKQEAPLEKQFKLPCLQQQHNEEFIQSSRPIWVNYSVSCLDC